MSKFVRSNPRDGAPPRLPGVTQQRHQAEQVSVGEPYQLQGDAELKREIESSLAIIARERLLEVEAQAKSFLTRSQDEAAKILERANAQAKEMITQARAEEEGIREKAYEEGFKTGFEEGYSDATNQVTEETQSLLKGAQVLVDGAYLAEQRVMQHFEKDTLGLIRHLVKQILHRELSDSPETTLHMIRRAVERLYITGKVQVVVNAQVIQDLRSYNAATEQSVSDMHRFEFMTDPILDAQQIYIIGQDSCFDLSPDTQLEQYLSAIEPQLQLPRNIPDAEETSPIALDQANAAIRPEAPESITPILAARSEKAVTTASVTESDPVAWEEFPTEIQALGGFSLGMHESPPETTDAEGSASTINEVVAPVQAMPDEMELALAEALNTAEADNNLPELHELPEPSTTDDDAGDAPS